MKIKVGNKGNIKVLLAFKDEKIANIDSKLKNYIEEKKAREFSSNWDMFLNLNTQDDLENFLYTQKESCS